MKNTNISWDFNFENKFTSAELIDFNPEGELFTVNLKSIKSIPLINDSLFCTKLGKIKLAEQEQKTWPANNLQWKNIRFWVLIDANGHASRILSKSLNKNQLPGFVQDISRLLENTRWNSNKKTEVGFNVSIENGEIRKAVLVRRDNRNITLEICK
ncbi:hypothetical protein [Ferruginibacter sp. HRS2-29]|uniref:hypothetical protein n=1 Tax=Ferruginibacter sp. HRS2-29 TaxID=2487334 RepID=UPI0020CC060F|nr:hypothetical protein [Ferruginibacter sp. HRS2-29]